jgi:hypothetical protein
MQRCPFEQYLAKIFITNRVFTTQRGFTALEMAQGGAGGVVRKKHLEWAVCLIEGSPMTGYFPVASLHWLYRCNIPRFKCSR